MQDLETLSINLPPARRRERDMASYEARVSSRTQFVLLATRDPREGYLHQTQVDQGEVTRLVDICFPDGEVVDLTALSRAQQYAGGGVPRAEPPSGPLPEPVAEAPEPPEAEAAVPPPVAKALPPDMPPPPEPWRPADPANPVRQAGL